MFWHILRSEYLKWQNQYSNVGNRLCIKYMSTAFYSTETLNKAFILRPGSCTVNLGRVLAGVVKIQKPLYSLFGNNLEFSEIAAFIQFLLAEKLLF